MLMQDGVNMTRFNGLKEELDNDYSKKNDTYPTNCNTVLQLLNSRKGCGPIKQVPKSCSKMP